MELPLIGQGYIYLKDQTYFRVVHDAEPTTPGEASVCRRIQVIPPTFNLTRGQAA